MAQAWTGSLTYGTQFSQSHKISNCEIHRSTAPSFNVLFCDSHVAVVRRCVVHGEPASAQTFDFFLEDYAALEHR